MEMPCIVPAGPPPAYLYPFQQGDKIVVIELGQAGVRLSMHLNLLCNESVWFEDLRTNKLEIFAQGQPAVITMADVEPEVFGVFSDWIYGDKYRVGGVVLPLHAPHDEPIRPDLRVAAAAYSLGGWLKAQCFMDQIADAARAALRPPPANILREPELQHIEIKDIILSQGSVAVETLFYRLLQDYLRYYIYIRTERDMFTDSLPEDLKYIWLALEGRILENIEADNPPIGPMMPHKAPRCYYHVHGHDYRCAPIDY
ncbi:uncharacterized protein BP5553_01523 [Venustampulla echinocandica]|uniref:BTB domain-containing protein n=1 Tax=Venustampulla echinocandica TaxID=2656787 RepID=A0A370U1A3_9HELO|nr:uncharacterized protein BP5553_01523 [Venustampulla echinocandica]RDL41544.1 hypothetical protein BP5553_01523 [Venustampulla echinocandica]